MDTPVKSKKKFHNPGFIGLLGGKDVVGMPVQSDFDVVMLSKEGITKRSIESLVSYLGISKKAFAENILGASVKTLERKKDTDKMSVQISSTVIEIAKVIEHALDVFEDEENVKRWLNSPIRALIYEKRIDLMPTTAGLKMVNDILRRIEYGVYS